MGTPPKGVLKPHGKKKIEGIDTVGALQPIAHCHVSRKCLRGFQFGLWQTLPLTVDNTSSENSLRGPLSRRYLVRSKLIQEVIGKSHPTHLIQDYRGFRPTAVIRVCSITKYSCRCVRKYRYRYFGNYVTFRRGPQWLRQRGCFTLLRTPLATWVSRTPCG